MNKTSTDVPRWVYGFAAAAAFFALISLYFRHKVEHRTNAVAMAVEGEVAESLGSAQGLGFKDSLRVLQAKGFNAVVLSEETIGEMATAGLAEFGMAYSAGADPGGPAAILVGSGQSEKRMMRGLKLRLPGVKIVFDAEHSEVRVYGARLDLIRTVAVGINPEQAKAARQLGMTVIARCSNPAGAGVDCVTGTVDWARELGATVFLPMGDQVLGRRDAVDPFIASLRKQDMLYASPEFAKIGGDSVMLEKAPGIAIRLHSAQKDELDKMSLAETVERYVLAARERDVRALLVRPLTYAGPKPLDALADLGHSIGRQLEREGGELHAPHAYPEPKVPGLVFALLAVAICGTAVGVVGMFTLAGPVLIGGGFVALVLFFGSMFPSVRPLTALLAAITFPTLAFLTLGRTQNVIQEYLAASGISLIGGLCVAGLLNDVSYFVRAQQFFGVKAAQFVPIAIVAVYFLWKLCEVKGLGKNAVLWWQVLLGLAGITALALMWMRSGNDNPAAVSGMELKMRSLLAHFLNVRPRTKELFIGHPLMIVGIAMLLRAYASKVPKPKNGGWIVLALTGGAIGQTSIVNTMCHLHTPLEVGLIRILFGVVLGGILGLVLWAIISRWAPNSEG